MATFNTDASGFAGFTFSSPVGVKAEDLKAKADYESGELKLVDGKPQWKTGLTCLILDEEGNVIRQDQGVTVAVLNKIDIVRNVDYKLAGKIRVTPYVTSNNRQGLSVVADGLVPAKADQKQG